MERIVLEEPLDNGPPRGPQGPLPIMLGCCGENLKRKKRKKLQLIKNNNYV